MSIDIEKDVKEAVHRAEDARRERTPARIAWHMAVVIGLACLLLGYIMGHLHQ